ncbi:cell division protein FtsL [Pragia fontium]|uniref:Cell division protein FtsL n=2 Tax=Pragia fontium TaxID=82985 RepID=A0AAJ4W7K3_9GAMM|nr:cell division protein FtsL [Pragia fontium]AKJ41417.1 cell division protein FtsL [Pragia fontium]SFC00034.1 cell division protein FtsL [Pragia fontium DSM 5563 = ATCC 49100]SUB81678.1 Cell division protein FtsL [Pragia fontium]VEJ54202.1 Cell division protein FtsL [Pragia fontium]GKX62978.1 cell division protein FtsL [Pragia fontium]
MIPNERHNLVSIIGDDLLRHAKLPLIFMVLVLVSAMAVVLSSHRTRLLTAEREQLILEREALEIEWRNLILEENALGDHSRIERLANEKIQMQHVTPDQEQIVIQK